MLKATAKWILSLIVLAFYVVVGSAVFAVVVGLGTHPLGATYGLNHTVSDLFWTAITYSSILIVGSIVMFAIQGITIAISELRRDNRDSIITENSFEDICRKFG
jgi:ABC-type Fe3+ transport system permease subunit